MTHAVTTGTVDVGPGPIEYEELAGSDNRAPLVFLHEGLGSLRLWRSFPRVVAQATGRRSLIFSRHGYGGSAPAIEPRGTDVMHQEAIDILSELLERLGYDEPVLLGHSDGASIVLIHAGAGAGKPVGLILLAPHVIVEDITLEGIRTAQETFASTDMGERMGRYHADPAATFKGWSNMWLSPELRDWDIREVLPGVSCPTLLIQGVDDDYGTMHQLDLIEGGVTGPTHRVELADCGHSPHLDQPEATLAAITAFLAELGR